MDLEHPENTILVVPSEEGWEVVKVGGNVESTFPTKLEAEEHAAILAKACGGTVMTSFVKPRKNVVIAPDPVSHGDVQEIE